MRGLIRPFALALLLLVLLAGARGRTETTSLPGPRVALLPVAEGFARPTDVAFSGRPGDERIFVVEQAGLIRTVTPGSDSPAVFLDIRDRVVFSGELGLLGLVFDPVDPDLLYVNYTTNQDGQLASRLARFEIAPNGKTAEASSELVLLQVDQPYSNHNGGDLAFGADGYLYAALGDGGGSYDPLDQGQALDSLLGKILRLDVAGASSGAPYAVPADNPFVGQAGVRPEIWAYGLRNPWRFSFDRLTGDIYIADVGQGRFEEVNRLANGGPGANYGWRCYEGFEERNLTGCQPAEAYDFPVHVYAHPAANCASITGGYLYRGLEISDLTGLYVFSDWCIRDLWALDPANGFQPISLGHYAGERLTSFGEDPQGELYAVSSGGRLLRLVDVSGWQRVYLPMTAAPSGAVAGATNAP